jgi:hypothetical protein
MKKKIAVIIVITVLYFAVSAVLAWYYAYEKYQELLYYSRTLGGTPDMWASVIDFTPFILTWEAGVVFVFGAIIAITWIVIGTRMPIIQRVSIAALVMFLFFTPFIESAFADTTVTYNVLLALDSHDSQKVVQSWAPLLSSIKQYWVGHYQVMFNFLPCSWSYSGNQILSGLKDCISQLNWSWGKTYQGYTCQLLIALTGYWNPPYSLVPWQKGNGGDGVSIPSLRAMFCVYSWNPEVTVMHELGHQFDLGHDPNWFCWMNPTFCYLLAQGFCDACAKNIKTNKSCLGLPPPPPNPDISAFFDAPLTPGGRGYDHCHPN